MKIIDYKECPFCNIKLTNINTGTTTSINRMCNSCKRYTWYQKLVPTRESVTQSFYDEHNEYNIIVLSFHGNAESNHILLRKGYTDIFENIEIEDIEHIKRKLENISVFASLILI